MRIAAILGHPHAGSFNRALARAYLQGAERGGATIDRIDLSELDFDPVLRNGYAEIQPLEPDLQRAQRIIERADHLLVAYPVWWGACPALLKGFFDRAFLPGWAFRFRGRWPLPERLLSGRSAHVIVTMDAPLPIYALLYRGSAHRSVIQGTLGFSGIGPISTTTVSAVKYQPEWLLRARVAQVARLGERHAARASSTSSREDLPHAA